MAEGESPTLSTTLSTSIHRHLAQTHTSTTWPDVESRGTNIVINISSNDGSTGRGILIGILSAFGSAAFVILIFALFYFFRHTTRGRIFLDRIGRPGEYDDEQAFAREEAEALDEMDDLQRAEYLRAKGRSKPSTHTAHSKSFISSSTVFLTSFDILYSFHPSQPARDFTYRHLTFPVLSHTRERGLSLGI